MSPELQSYIANSAREICDTNAADHKSTTTTELERDASRCERLYLLGQKLMAEIGQEDLLYCQKIHALKNQYRHSLVEIRVLDQWVLVPSYVAHIDYVRKLKDIFRTRHMLQSTPQAASVARPEITEAPCGYYDPQDGMYMLPGFLTPESQARMEPRYTKGALLTAYLRGVNAIASQQHLNPNTARLVPAACCKDCGWPIISACCNGLMATAHPENDYWMYCSNQGCANHKGDAYGPSHTPEFLTHSLADGGKHGQ